MKRRAGTLKRWAQWAVMANETWGAQERKSRAIPYLQTTTLRRVDPSVRFCIQEERWISKRRDH